LPAEQGRLVVCHASTLFWCFVHAFGIHTEAVVCHQLLFWLLPVPGCATCTHSLVHLPDGACMQVLLDHPYSQGEAQMLTGVL
jgi:hypothetical protein